MIFEYIVMRRDYKMSEVREIVTRAVLAKGKKIFRIHDIVTPGRDAYSILGCWVINHEFDASLNDKTVISG